DSGRFFYLGLEILNKRYKTYATKVIRIKAFPMDFFN
ncbi:MAG: hypothetical protein ACJAZG_002349, partial [Granulosicoccus sp.]